MQERILIKVKYISFFLLVISILAALMFHSEWAFALICCAPFYGVLLIVLDAKVGKRKNPLWNEGSKRGRYEKNIYRQYNRVGGGSQAHVINDAQIRILFGGGGWRVHD